MHRKIWIIRLVAATILQISTPAAAGPPVLSPADLDAAIEALPNRPGQDDRLAPLRARLAELTDRASASEERQALDSALSILRLARGPARGPGPATGLLPTSRPR